MRSGEETKTPLTAFRRMGHGPPTSSGGGGRLERGGLDVAVARVLLELSPWSDAKALVVFASCRVVCN